MKEARGEGAGAAPEHPQLEALPEWPVRTVAVLATVDERPHAIPVSAPIRAGDRRILISLSRGRGSLARLRARKECALLVLAEGNVAFTAHGGAQVVEDPMEADPDYAAVAIEVDRIDDHRQAAFAVDGGVSRTWLDETEQRALGARVKALQSLAREP